MRGDEGLRGLDRLGMGGYVTDLLVMAEIVLASRGDRSNDVDGERLTGPQNQDIANFSRPLLYHGQSFMKRPLSFVAIR